MLRYIFAAVEERLGMKSEVDGSFQNLTSFLACVAEKRGFRRAVLLRIVSKGEAREGFIEDSKMRRFEAWKFRQLSLHIPPPQIMA